MKIFCFFLFLLYSFSGFIAVILFVGFFTNEEFTLRNYNGKIILGTAAVLILISYLIYELRKSIKLKHDNDLVELEKSYEDIGK